MESACSLCLSGKEQNLPTDSSHICNRTFSGWRMSWALPMTSTCSQRKKCKAVHTCTMCQVAICTSDFSLCIFYALLWANGILFTAGKCATFMGVLSAVLAVVFTPAGYLAAGRARAQACWNRLICLFVCFLIGRWLHCCTKMPEYLLQLILSSISGVLGAAGSASLSTYHRINATAAQARAEKLSKLGQLIKVWHLRILLLRMRYAQLKGV